MAQERFEEAYRQFMDALQAAWTAPDIRERGEYAHVQYMQVLQEASYSELLQRVSAAYANYMAVIQDALQQQDVRQQASDAYRLYLQAVREAWLDTDVDALDAATLAAISQSMLTAASLAAVSTGVPGAEEGVLATPAHDGPYADTTYDKAYDTLPVNNPFAGSFMPAGPPG